MDQSSGHPDGSCWRKGRCGERPGLRHRRNSQERRVPASDRRVRSPVEPMACRSASVIGQERAYVRARRGFDSRVRREFLKLRERQAVDLRLDGDRFTLRAPAAVILGCGETARLQHLDPQVAELLTRTAAEETAAAGVSATSAPVFRTAAVAGGSAGSP